MEENNKLKKETFSKNVHDYIELISVYLNKKEMIDHEYSVDELAFFKKLSKFHSLSALYYLAIRDLKISIDFDDLKKLEERYLSILRRDILLHENLDHELM